MPYYGELDYQALPSLEDAPLDLLMPSRMRAPLPLRNPMDARGDGAWQAPSDLPPHLFGRMTWGDPGLDLGLPELPPLDWNMKPQVPLEEPRRGSGSRPALPRNDMAAALELGHSSGTMPRAGLSPPGLPALTTPDEVSADAASDVALTGRMAELNPYQPDLEEPRRRGFLDYLGSSLANLRPIDGTHSKAAQLLTSAGLTFGNNRLQDIATDEQRRLERNKRAMDLAEQVNRRRAAQFESDLQLARAKALEDYRRKAEKDGLVRWKHPLTGTTYLLKPEDALEADNMVPIRGPDGKTHLVAGAVWTQFLNATKARSSETKPGDVTEATNARLRTIDSRYEARLQRIQKRIENFQVEVDKSLRRSGGDESKIRDPKFKYNKGELERLEAEQDRVRAEYEAERESALAGRSSGGVNGATGRAQESAGAPPGQQLEGVGRQFYDHIARTVQPKTGDELFEYLAGSEPGSRQTRLEIAIANGVDPASIYRAFGFEPPQAKPGGPKLMKSSGSRIVPN